MRYYIFCLFCLVNYVTTAQAILIDETFADWNNPDIVVYEEAGDNNRLDIVSLAITDDADFLYLK